MIALHKLIRHYRVNDYRVRHYGLFRPCSACLGIGIALCFGHLAMVAGLKNRINH